MELETVPSGFTTVRLLAPEEAMRLAGTKAVSWPAFWKVVANEAPAHITTEPAKKPAPDTVTVKAAPPASTWLGLAETINSGAGTLALTQLDTIPPETTETVAPSGPPTKLAGTDAVNCVAPTVVAVKGEPFQRSVESARKPVPKTAIARAEPAPGD
jgi:hypothetical protein